LLESPIETAVQDGEMGVRHLVEAVAESRCAFIVYITEEIALVAASSIACDIVELAIAYLSLVWVQNERVHAYAYASASVC
jgi:hypothetical protein